MRILLAEDDDLLGSGLKAGLGQHGFAVDWVRDGVAAERELLTGNYEASCSTSACRARTAWTAARGAPRAATARRCWC